jgi:hypothetical protein
LKCPKRNGHFDKDSKMDMLVLGDEDVTLLHILILENEDIKLVLNGRILLPIHTVSLPQGMECLIKN